MSRSDLDSMARELVSISEGETTDNELVFDSQTHELVHRPRSNSRQNPDDTLVNPMIEEGYAIGEWQDEALCISV